MPKKHCPEAKWTLSVFFFLQNRRHVFENPTSMGIFLKFHYLTFHNSRMYFKQYCLASQELQLSIKVSLRPRMVRSLKYFNIHRLSQQQEWQNFRHIYPRKGIGRIFRNLNIKIFLLLECKTKKCVDYELILHCKKICHFSP